MIKKITKKQKKSPRVVVRKRESYSYQPQQIAYKQQSQDQGVGYQAPVSVSSGGSGKSPMFMSPMELEEYNPRLPNRHKHGGYPIRHEEALAVAYWLLARKMKKGKKTAKANKKTSKKAKKQQKNRTFKTYRMQSHMGVRCADCRRYIRLPCGYMGCGETLIKISKPQSLRKIDCVFFEPTYIEI
jgi:hypothetical protein